MSAILYPSHAEIDARAGALMRRMQADDHDALAEFIADTRGLLLWDMRRRGVSPQLREDCMQSIYLNMWKLRHGIRPEGAMPYLNTIMKLEINRTLADQNRRPDVPVADPVRWLYINTAPEPGPERAAVAKEAAAEAQARCGKVVAALPAHLRSVLRAYVQDLSPEEAARRLGLPLYQVWDFTLEALAEAKRIAGVPTTNPEIEQRLQECGLWPAECGRLPVDVGQLLRRLPVGQRSIIYCRLMGMNTTETARHIGLANIKSLGNVIRTKLRTLAECFGCIPPTGARADGVVPLAEAAPVLHVNPKVAQQAAEGAGVVLVASPDGRPGVRLADFPAVWAAAVSLPPKKGGRPAIAR